MATISLNTAATGLSALSQDIDVIANNSANSNTTGYKSLRSNFEDLLYQEKEQPGVEVASGEQRPTGLYVGLGTRIAGTQLDLTVGSAIQDTNDFSMMIDGQGFFQVTSGDRILYSRAGNFFPNSNGELTLGNGIGARLEPPIVIPESATGITIAPDGTISALVDGGTVPEEIGQVQLALFPNSTGIKPVGRNLFEETLASGPPIIGTPGEGNFGDIRQKFLEASNVDPVKELINLIKTQRAFEMNSQVIKASDEALQVIANLSV